MSRLNFAPQAREDLQQIYDYIAQEDPRAAMRVIDRLERRAEFVVDNPGTGHKRDDLVANMRSVAEGNYLIFYFTVANGIEVTRVLHAKRDIEQIFEKYKQD